MLEHSSVFTLLSEGRAPLVNYFVNGNDYTMDIILLMVYIQSGPRLSKQFHIQEAISKYILHELKSQPERMLRELLECSKHDLL